jgi:hypothetical protein
VQAGDCLLCVDECPGRKSAKCLFQGTCSWHVSCLLSNAHLLKNALQLPIGRSTWLFRCSRGNLAKTNKSRQHDQHSSGHHTNSSQYTPFPAGTWVRLTLQRSSLLGKSQLDVMIVREGAVSSHQGGGRAQLPHARGVGGGGGGGGIMDPLLGSFNNMKLITDLNDGVKSLAGSCTSPSVRGQRMPHAARPLRSQIAAGRKLTGSGTNPSVRAQARQFATA